MGRTKCCFSFFSGLSAAFGGQGVFILLHLYLVGQNLIKKATFRRLKKNSKRFFTANQMLILALKETINYKYLLIIIT